MKTPSRPVSSRRLVAASALLAAPLFATVPSGPQQPYDQMPPVEKLGEAGSIAAWPPPHEIAADKRILETLTREIYLQEGDEFGVADANNMPVKPVPTNDWWSDLPINGDGGLYWQYPLTPKILPAGLEIRQIGGIREGSNGGGRTTVAALRVTGWNGQDAAANPRNTPSVELGKARASGWSDWMVTFRKTAAANPAQTMDVTMARCMPYVWIETKGMDPLLSFDVGATVKAPEFFDAAGQPLAAADLGARDTLAIGIEGKFYGVHAPAGTTFRALPGGAIVVQLPAGQRDLAVSALPSLQHLSTFAQYAYAKPVKTIVTYAYDPAKPETNGLSTRWTYEVKALRPGADTVLQGWLAPHYRGTTHDIKFIPGLDFDTPRGRLRVAAAPAAKGFSVEYPFNGVMSHLAAPQKLGLPNDVDEEYIRALLLKYDDKNDGTAGDTYFGAKNLVLHARAMHMAKEMGLTETYKNLKAEIEASLADWFTYTDGEQSRYFARNKRWGSLVGFNFVHDFNLGRFTDIHFHYGYYTLAYAYVAMDDPVFRDKYKEIAIELAQAYANWDRDSKKYPWMRTFEPMVGHSYAGGTGSSGGNNQESSSESIQSWAGLFLLGEALRGNDPRAADILAAGAFGYALETRAVLEYYQDYNGSPFASAPLDYDNQPAKDGKRYPIWPDEFRNGRSVRGFPEKKALVYTNGIMGDGGNTFATYFGAQPEFIYGIQWLPNAPHMLFLARDPKFALGQFSTFLAYRDEHYASDWLGAVFNTPKNLRNEWYKKPTDKNPDPRKFAVDNPWGGSDMKGLVQNLYKLNPAFVKDISHEGDPDRDNPFYDEKNRKWLIEFPADRPKDVVFPKEIWDADAIVANYPHLVPPPSEAGLADYSLSKWVNKAFMPPAGPGPDWKNLSAMLSWNPADYPETPEGHTASITQLTNALESIGGSWPLITLTFAGFADPELGIDVFAESRRRNNAFAEHTETGLFAYYYFTALRGLGRTMTDQHLSIPASLVFLNDQTGERSYMVHNKSDRAELVDVFAAGKKIGQVLAQPGRVTLQRGLFAPSAGFSPVGTLPMAGSTVGLVEDTVSVVFSEPVDPKSLAGKITLAGPGDLKLVPVASEGPALVAAYRVEGVWKPGARYTVKIADGIKSARGAAAKAGEFSFNVAQTSGARLLGTAPGANAKTVNPALKTLVLEFNTRIDPATLSGVTLTGPTTPGLTLDSTASKPGRVAFTLDASLKPDAAYTLTVPATVADVFSQKLGETAAINFTTAQPDTVLAAWESVIPASRLKAVGSSGDKTGAFEIGQRWDFDAVGDYVEIAVRAEKAGAYALKGSCKEYSARGEFRVSVNGTPLEKTWRQYDGQDRMAEELGIATLKEGANTLRFEVVAANPAEPQKPWLVIDTLTFTPVK